MSEQEEQRAQLLNGPIVGQLPDACPEHDYRMALNGAMQQRPGAPRIKALVDNVYARGWYDGYVALRNELEKAEER